MLKRLTLTVTVVLFCIAAESQTPIHNSNPGITNKVIFLDFDGQVVKGTSWNNGNTINATPSLLFHTEKTSIWQRVSEDFMPFDVNVTTDSVRFNNAPPNKRMRVIITPFSSWYGQSGGVAYVGSFAWGGTPGTPCWVFEDQLNYVPKDISDAASHEVGHTLSLYHQSRYNGSCIKTDEYHDGTGGTGVTSWGPIMGAPYSRNVTIWHSGTSTNGCNVIQNDHGSPSPGLTGNLYLSFKPDDIGNTFATAKILNLTALNHVDSGLITSPSDLDVFRFSICNNRYVSVNAKPWARDTVSFDGADLDIKLKLFNSNGSLIAGDSSTTKLKALVGANLTPGSYYFTIKGDGSPFHTDYGSLGRYNLNIKATNPPTIAVAINLSSGICAGQNTALNHTVSVPSTSWLWNIAGPSPGSYSVQNPSHVFAAGGVYTISLIAANGSYTGCPVSNTINVGTQPTVAITGIPDICLPKNATLTAIGATSYTWMPGGFNGATQILFPSSSTVFSVTGANGSCKHTATVSVPVTPPFNVSINASVQQVCPGQAVTLTGSGANNYFWQPGNLSGAVQSFTPSAGTTYTLTGNIGNCYRSNTISIGITQITVNVSMSQPVICYGKSVTLTASGASNYTFNPGGVTANPAVFSPTANTSYIVTGVVNQCIKTVTANVTVEPDFALSLIVSDTLLCEGDIVYITGFGANSFTFNPGSLGGGNWTVAPVQPSTYTITGAYNEICPKDTVIFINVRYCEPAGVKEYTGNDIVSLFPNPASGNFTIQSGTLFTHIDVYSAVGGKIYSDAVPLTGRVRISTEGWPTGVYFVKTRAAGKEDIVKMLVLH